MKLFVKCQGCELEHAAEYSHESLHSQGSIYAVVCTSTDEWITDYYTSELLYSKKAEMDKKTVVDGLGVEILVGDTILIIGWGWNVRLMDVGHKATVTGITWAGNLKHDTDEADGYALHPSCVAVCRRDGKPGHEGNRK